MNGSFCPAAAFQKLAMLKLLNQPFYGQPIKPPNNINRPGLISQGKNRRPKGSDANSVYKKLFYIAANGRSSPTDKEGYQVPCRLKIYEACRIGPLKLFFMYFLKFY